MNKDLASDLVKSNGMVLLSSSDDDGTVEGIELNGQIPCNKVLAQTPWKRKRDEILFDFLKRFLNNVYNGTQQPVLILTNSVVEVSLFTSNLRSNLPTNEEGILAIGTNMSASALHSEILSKSGTLILVLSSQMALAAFVHGIIRIQEFSLVLFADARGANQNHPFCIIMNHFYTPLRLLSSLSLPRIVGFAELKPADKIEADMFSRRDWSKTLKHYTHTFNCIPMTLSSSCSSIEDYLESFDSFSGGSVLFDPLSIYEITRIEPSITNDDTRVVESLIATMYSPVMILRHESTCEDIPQLISLLKDLKASGVQRLIHVHPGVTGTFSAKLSLFSCFKSLKVASDTSPLDHSVSQDICKETTSLFSQSEHLLSSAFSKASASLRNPRTGSLLIESTAIPILVRCCALLGREFRQSAANETVQFKTIRVFPQDSNGQRQSTHPQHLSLLKLPGFFYERIKESITQIPSIENDKFHLQGPLCSSRHQAQCAAAYEAALLLFNAGLLDDNLLLSSEFRKALENDQEESIENEDVTEEEEDEASECTVDLSFNELIPRGLLKVKSITLLHLYAIEYEVCMYRTLEDPLCVDPDPLLLTPYSRLLLASSPMVDFFSVSKSSRTWAILLPRELPQGFVPVEIPIGTDHYLRTELKKLENENISIDSEEYKRLLEAQEGLFGMFNMKPITATVRKNDDENISNSVPEDKLPFYLIAPLRRFTENDEDLNNSIAGIARVWDLFVSFVDAFKAAPLEGSFYHLNQRQQEQQDKSLSWSVDWKFVEACMEPPQGLSQYIESLEHFQAGKMEQLSVLLEEGGVPVDFKRFALERLSFFTPHTKIFYRLNNKPLPEKIFPTSPFISETFPQVTTHAEYLAERYGLHVREMDKEMLSVRRIENWNDLAAWISDDGASKKRRRKTSSSRSTNLLVTSSVIIPEFTRIFPGEYSFFRVAMLLPRVSFEIERQLRISQFFCDQLPSLGPPSHERQVEALTASTAALSYSYEQLEVLGDSFLKYYSTLDTLLVGSGWSEGRLSSHRQRILCNANLRAAAERLNITTYASFTPFFGKLWCPPALNCSSVLFDGQERWRLLATVEGKQVQKQVVYLLDPHGKLSIDPTYKTKEQVKNSTDAIFKYGQLVPPKSLADMLEALIGIYYIDGGVQGCLRFLVFCGVLREDIFEIRHLDPLTVLLGRTAEVAAGKEELLEKLKRRKMTPINNLIITTAAASTPDDANKDPTSQQSLSLATAIKSFNSLNVPVAQKIENVLPSAASFADFPFQELEDILLQNYNYNDRVFRHREILFMACTHSSIDSKINNERLEWIGDAAIDWLVCRHYWYNCRFPSSDDQLKKGSYDRDQECDLDQLEHPCRSHVPIGFLPLSPESLTNARQSAINNESFARLIVRFGLNRFLRINSPHLQIEIQRYCAEIEKIIDNSPVPRMFDDHTTPEVLKNLHTHVSVGAPKVLGDLFEALMGALLMDSNFDIDHFAQCFQPFLEACCADPADLPINAIQETLHLYARMGIPRNQIVCTYKEISSITSLGVICQVWVRERCVAEAEGSNKAVAKKLAMQRALHELTNNITE